MGAAPPPSPPRASANGVALRVDDGGAARPTEAVLRAAPTPAS